MTLEILTRDTCPDCEGSGCDACSNTGKIEAWLPVEKVAEAADSATFAGQYRTSP